MFKSASRTRRLMHLAENETRGKRGKKRMHTMLFDCCDIQEHAGCSDVQFLDQMLKMVLGGWVRTYDWLNSSILYTYDFRSNNVGRVQVISSAAGTNLEREGDIKNREMAQSVTHERRKQIGNCWTSQHQTKPSKQDKCGNVRMLKPN